VSELVVGIEFDNPLTLFDGGVAVVFKQKDSRGIDRDDGRKGIKFLRPLDFAEGFL
jgi:hypothetical protein